MDETDWTSEFDLFKIPYACCYVYENLAKKRLKVLNEKFNEQYADYVRKSEIKIKFAKDVTVIDI